MKIFIGQKLNRLTIVKELERRSKSRGKIYLCQCDCGNTKEVSRNKLLNGTKSCGCLKAENLLQEIGKNNFNFSGYEGISGAFWGRIKANAKQRKKEFAITIEYIWELFLKQEERCALSGCLLRLPDTLHDLYNKSVTASLDRIDSTKGYIIGNVQWIHKDINYMKWKFPESHLLFLCKEIVNFQSVKKQKSYEETEHIMYSFPCF